MKKKKLKISLASWLASFLFIASWVVIGVAFAIKTVNVGLNGEVTFTATGVHARITGNITGTKTANTLKPIEIEAETTEIETWDDVKFDFKDENTAIVTTITVENLSDERSLYVTFEDNIDVSNITIDKTLGSAPVTSSFSTDTISSLSAKTFTITMKVDDKNKSVSGNFHFNVTLSNEELKEANATNYPTLSFATLDTTAKTMSISSGTTTPTGTLVIPERVLYNNEVYAVTEIADNAFKDNTNITAVTFPSTLTKIGESAFRGTGLTTLTIPDNVKIIGGSAFRECASLEVLNLNASSKEYAYGVFYQCTALKTVNIGSGCSGFNQEWFCGCAALEEIVIPSHTTFLNYCLFQNCYALKSVTIQEGVTTLAQGVFSNCTSLSSITIPSSVTTIGIDAFNGCTNLKSVTFENPTGWTSNGDSLDLSNPEQNANLLKTTYKEYDWNRS